MAETIYIYSDQRTLLFANMQRVKMMYCMDDASMGSRIVAKHFGPNEIETKIGSEQTN